MNDKEILRVKNLVVDVKGKNGKRSEIIKNISFELNKGECLGILGESGSGKSMSMKAILGLLDSHFIIRGSAYYKNMDLMLETPEKLRSYRGNDIAVILQNPMTCFDPLFRMEDQMKETWQSHLNLSKRELHEKALSVLRTMQIPNERDVLRKYPHQLSGGMLQRITIGLALSMEPEILIADEPTSSIDAITQFEIMKEFQKIKEKCGTSMIFITHDLSVISQVADRILVMNQGEIVDMGDFKHITTKAQDEYTRHLVRSKMMVMRQYNQVLQKGETL
ncbi:ABC transporter ATP-binding protein [Anaerosacchariphilus polymeriproducens]|uniref:ABC transporter ATP-binding protein n=1 Tax=Anaerosacchariphilus polymeriproducens TaxID=1812858 RepID=A0A371AW56_9FIRM|nr:ABC transporter ATP-binding protein [Anaerosacchariphilus polymeriproducens]RDU23815.1 ABC transporter ATP-binding protein [Anaerosacchariphilus polymeriproducens]